MINSIGIIITKTPYGSDKVENALMIGREALAAGKELGIFLLGDGVWVGKSGKNEKMQKILSDFINKGAKVFVSEPHMKACGLTDEKIANDSTIIKKPYARLVDLVMEEWDKVIVL